jgi:hypothetical protein
MLTVPVPPVMVATADPLEPPKQLTAVVAVIATLGPDISLILAIAATVQLLASVTVTV